MRNNSKTGKKFKILELINNARFSERKKVKKEVFDLLEVSETTFKRILYATIGDGQEISATNLMKLSQYFGVPAEELMNEGDTISIGSDLVQ